MRCAQIARSQRLIMEGDVTDNWPTDADIERARIPKEEKEAEAAADDWGCDHCRNDGKLENGRCPKCDAEFPDEE